MGTGPRLEVVLTMCFIPDLGLPGLGPVWATATFLLGNAKLSMIFPEPVQKSPGMAQTGDETHSPIRAKSGPTSPIYSPIVSRAARSGPSRAVCFIPYFGFLTWAWPGPQ